MTLKFPRRMEGTFIVEENVPEINLTVQEPRVLDNIDRTLLDNIFSFDASCSLNIAKGLSLSANIFLNFGAVLDRDALEPVFQSNVLARLHHDRLSL